MFSQKSSTMMPVRDQSIHFLEHNQYSAGIMASSEDTYTYSQSMQSSNVYQDNNNWNYDNSQSHNSQSQDVNLKTYIGKPLLFSGRIPMQPTYVSRGRNTNNSIGQFYDIQQRKNCSNEKEVLSTFLSALKEYSEEMKGSLEGMKSNISAEFQSNVEAMMSSFNNTGDILKKFQSDLTKKLESVDVNKENEWKEAALEKDTEIATKEETINQMKIQINQLSSSCEAAMKKENNFFEGQQRRMKELLSCCNTSADSLEHICSKEVEHYTMLEQLLQQNKNVSQNIASILSWQKATNHILSSVNSSLAAVSANVNELNSVGEKSLNIHPNQNFVHGAPNPMKKTVNLPLSNIVPGSHKSPLPKFTRWFDVNGKPSPAAFIPPVVRETKPEKRPCQLVQKVQPAKRVMPSFDQSSDSDSGHEMSEIIDKVVNDLPLRRKVKSKVKQLTADITYTPISTVNTNKVNSTPIQRSIRRYARIRKKPFTPSPLKIVNSTSFQHNVKSTDSNPTKHIKKKFITLEQHFNKVG